MPPRTSCPFRMPDNPPDPGRCHADPAGRARRAVSQRSQPHHQHPATSRSRGGQRGSPPCRSAAHRPADRLDGPDGFMTCGLPAADAATQLDTAKGLRAVDSRGLLRAARRVRTFRCSRAAVRPTVTMSTNPRAGTLAPASPPGADPAPPRRQANAELATPFGPGERAGHNDTLPGR